MKGYPKFLSTKADYEYVRNNFPKEAWAKDFQDLLDTQYEWMYVKDLADGEIGLSDDTHKIEIDSEQFGGDGTRRQYEYVYNPNCKLVQLGYTEDEVKEFLL